MRFFEAIMKNWFIGMILFVLTALVLSVNTTNAAINSPYVQEKATSLFFHNKISQIAFNFIENDLENCCQNARNLVAYRNWVTSAAGNLADRLDRLNTKLEQENVQMRKALVSLCEAVEDILDVVEEESTKEKVQKAINNARIAFR